MGIRSIFRTVLAVAILGWATRAETLADELGDLLRTCQEACRGSIGVHVTFQRTGGKWMVGGVDLAFKDALDFDLAQLARLPSLESLELHHSTIQGLEKVRSLRGLRRISLPEKVTLAEWTALCRLPDLEDVDTWGVTEWPDGALKMLKDIRKLRRLDLRGAPITDDSMKHIKPLKTLEELDLSVKPSISDAGLNDLAGLSRLRVLKLSRLGLLGLAVLEKLPNLEHLEVVSFDPGPKGTDFSGLRRLQFLRIYQVLGDQTERVRLPESLRVLEVGIGLVPRVDVKSAPQLQRTVVETSSLNPEDFAAVNALDQMPGLELTLKLASDEDLKTISRIHSLRSLSVSCGCKPSYTDEGFKSLAHLDRLESLKFEGPKLTDEGIAILPHLPTLRHLDVSLLPGVSSRGLENLWKVKGLRTFRYRWQSRNHPLDSILSNFTQQGDLEELYLHGTLSDAGLVHLKTLKKLRVLDLKGVSGYTDEGLASLMNSLPNLEIVKRTYWPLRRR